MRRTLGSDARDIGALDPEAIAEVYSESWPVVRDPDELHDALLTLMAMSGFEPVPPNYQQQLADVAKAYPLLETTVAVPAAESIK